MSNEVFQISMSADLYDTLFSKSSIHYSLIAILLHLSNHPTYASYERTMHFQPEMEQDDFDWTAYLLQGEDRPSWNWDDDSSTDSIEEESSVQENIAGMSQLKPYVNAVISEKDSVTSFSTSDIVLSYWKFDRTHINLHDLCTLSSPTSATANKTIMKEVNVLREILWLLSGHNDLFVFPVNEGKHFVNKKVQLAHSSSESVQQSLQIFAACGDVVSQIREFILTPVSLQSLTYEAFAACLMKYLHWMKEDILIIEERLTSLQETILLHDLSEFFCLHIQILQIIKTVFDCSISRDKPEEKNAVKSSRLLCVLYEALLDENLICKTTESDKNLTTIDILLNLWIESTQPYIDIIDQWITKGVLDDPKSEFPLQRMPTFSGCQEANFWKDAIIPVIENVEKVLPWLSPLLNTIITGGKSREILQTLSIMCRMNREQSRDHLPNVKTEDSQDIYQHFLDNLTTSKAIPLPLAKEKTALSESNILSGKDVLLQANFMRLFEPSKNHSNVFADMSVSKQLRSAEPLPLLVVKSLQPIIEKKCKNANQQLLEIFKAKFDLCKTLDMFHNFYLMGWGDVMHYFATGVFEDLLTSDFLTNDLVGINILLQEAMSGRPEETVPIFVSIKSRPNEQKKDGGLIVVASEPKIDRHQTIDVTDNIELQCKIEWPINLVLSKECVALYNKVFSYLMQIKRAVFCVESLKFTTVYKSSLSRPGTTSHGVTPSHLRDDTMSVQVKSHRLAIFRARLLHLLQHWQGFVMTSVIQAEKHVFSQRISEAKTLDDILNAHSSFLERICSLCLLDEDKQASKLVQGTLKKIMTLSITFNILWNKGIDQIHSKSILKHEREFHECSEFLGRILKTIANRGAVPILDSLAYAILS